MIPMVKWWLNSAMLAAECQQVIFLRTMKLAAGGPAAQHEVERMFSEKMLAASVAGARLMRGASPDQVVRGYRRTVRANSRRLRG